ncbi:MAG: hypothetical protein MUF71_08710 [Candidatus Kapabacteria bacterium]|jgi:hypothetical protein|nr:hypothetical protein [Candidatus Kapabacteria bacterium]
MNNNPANLYEYIDFMRRRIGMFLGEESVSALNHHLTGYQMACAVKGIEEQLSPPFEDFHDFVAREYGLPFSNHGWAIMMLKQCNGNEQRAYQDFMRLFDLFRHEKNNAKNEHE